MWFTWLREQAGNDGPVEQNIIERLIFIIYNLVYWLPLVLTITKTIDYRMGIITFAAIIAVRTVLNWYRVNILSLEQAQRFPFRAP